MPTDVRPNSHKHGLSFLAVGAFLISFFAARTFALLNPKIVIVSQGVHFHHFWYGLALIATAGWLGLTARGERLDRIYAIAYGVGAGFIGDEIGLLLTFGDYNSGLTYDFFVAAIAFILLVTLLTKYRRQLERDVLSVPTRERLVLLGVIALSLSFLFLAFGEYIEALAVFLLGLLILSTGVWRERKEKSLPNG
ncbi:MAG: hypothetical protein OK422_04820 [Thaumarchaeota archaeon]|nr:hypothetical protein [Nitrososphaerota archaeon]